MSEVSLAAGLFMGVVFVFNAKSLMSFLFIDRKCMAIVNGKHVQVFMTVNKRLGLRKTRGEINDK
ncbi:hypothetical protein P4S72_16055 [Vibrio sp. PP-XX7]